MATETKSVSYEEIVSFLKNNADLEELTIAQLKAAMGVDVISGVMVAKLKENDILRDNGSRRENASGKPVVVYDNLALTRASKKPPTPRHDPFAAFPKQPIPEPTIGDTPLFTFSEEPKRDRYLDLLNYMEKQEAVLKANPDRYFHILTHGKVKLCLKYDA